MAKAAEKKKPKIIRDEKGRIMKGSVANPNGKPKGTKNGWTKDITAAVSEALNIVGAEYQEKDVTLQGFEAGTAYLATYARSRPELFIPMVKQLMPAKIDMEVQIMGRELIDLMTERRNKLAEMRDITPDNEEEDDK